MNQNVAFRGVFTRNRQNRFCLVILPELPELYQIGRFYQLHPYYSINNLVKSPENCAFWKVAWFSIKTLRFWFLEFGNFRDVKLSKRIECRRSSFTTYTLFENSLKCLICIFQLWHFPPIFDLLKVTCLVTLFDLKLQVFKNSPKRIIFWHF